MKVKIKLHKYYHHHLDKDIAIYQDVVESESEEGLKIKKLINDLNIPLDEVKIIMVNSRPKTLDDVLHDEDYVFIFPPVAGG